MMGERRDRRPLGHGWTNLAMVAVIGAVVVAVLPRLSWIWRAVVLGLVGLDAAAQGFGNHLVSSSRD